MNTSTRIARYLNDNQIPFQQIKHFHSNSSVGTGITASIALKHIAKAVILINHEDKKVMAVLPADHKISFSSLNESLHGSYRLMKEQEVYKLFSDCQPGAIPPIAQPYNLSVVCEEDLDHLPEVYLEAGDHETLICVDQESFKNIMTTAKHMHFSREVFH